MTELLFIMAVQLCLGILLFGPTFAIVKGPWPWRLALTGCLSTGVFFLLIYSGVTTRIWAAIVQD